MSPIASGSRASQGFLPRRAATLASVHRTTLVPTPAGGAARFRPMPASALRVYLFTCAQQQVGESRIHQKVPADCRGALADRRVFFLAPLLEDQAGGQASSVACRRMASRSRLLGPLFRWMQPTDETDGSR